MTTPAGPEPPSKPTDEESVGQRQRREADEKWEDSERDRREKELLRRVREEWRYPRT